MTAANRIAWFTPGGAARSRPVVQAYLRLLGALERDESVGPARAELRAALSELAKPAGGFSMLVFAVRSAALWLLGVLAPRSLDELLAAQVKQLTPGSSARECMSFARCYRALVHHGGEQRLNALMAAAEAMACKGEVAGSRASDRPPRIRWETLVVEVTCVAHLADGRRCVAEWTRERGLLRVACEREGEAAVSNLPAMTVLDPVLQWLGRLEAE